MKTENDLFIFVLVVKHFGEVRRVHWLKRFVGTHEDEESSPKQKHAIVTILRLKKSNINIPYRNVST